MSVTETELRGSVGIITLTHDERRNALSQALIDQLIADLDAFAARKVRVAVLRARPGTRVWSAGHDVSELPRSGRDPLAYNDPLEQGVRAIRGFPAPVLAMIEGSVWGGAVELALCCDVLIGAPDATFALTPAKIGVPYNPAGILRLMSAIDASLLLREMFFTARPISAERAHAVGMLNHVVPAAELEAFTLEMAGQIASLAPLSISVIKEQMRLLSDARPLSPDAFERIQGLRRRVYDSRDYREGITAFLEKRKPAYVGE